MISFDTSEQKRAVKLAELQARALEGMAGGEPLADALDLLMRFLEEHAEEELLASVLLLDEDGFHLRHGAAPSLPPAYNKAVDGVAVGPSVGSCGTAAFRRKTVVVADIASDPLWDGCRELALAHGLRACWSRPILHAQGDVLGTFAMYYREPRAPSPADLELSAVVTHIATVAIERARQEARLVRAEEKYLRLVEQLPLAVYVHTPGQQGSSIVEPRTSFSPRIESLLGYTPSEFLGDPELLARLLHPDDRERVEAEVCRARRSGERFSGQYRLIARDGRVVWAQDEAVCVRDEEGRIVRIEGYLIDVSERKALEAAFLHAQKMEAIGRLASGIAHDVNNMTSAIIGFAELVLGRLVEDDPVRWQVEEIRRAGERASELTHRMLGFSRKQVLPPSLLDVNTVVVETEKLLRRLIGEDIDLVSVLDPALEPVEADPGQLEQVLMNLAVNARDAMPTGGKLTIETANVDMREGYASSHVEVAPGSYVLLAVSDTGVGMDEQTQERIFEPFFTTKDQSTGTGLGLSTVLAIVEQSGGHISAYSEPGLGTTFKVYLPQARRPSAPMGTAYERQHRDRETVLLVEDEAIVRTVMRRTLEDRGYAVLEACDGAHALALGSSHEGPIDLLLTDVVMPGLDGRELADRLASLRPEMKVLYASGYPHQAIVRHRMLDAEAPFLPKPVTPNSLLHKVREILDGTAAPEDDRGASHNVV